MSQALQCSVLCVYDTIKFGLLLYQFTVIIVEVMAVVNSLTSLRLGVRHCDKFSFEVLVKAFMQRLFSLLNINDKWRR